VAIEANELALDRVRALAAASLSRASKLALDHELQPAGT